MSLFFLYSLLWVIDYRIVSKQMDCINTYLHIDHVAMTTVNSTVRTYYLERVALHRDVEISILRRENMWEKTSVEFNSKFGATACVVIKLERQ